MERRYILQGLITNPTHHGVLHKTISLMQQQFIVTHRQHYFTGDRKVLTDKQFFVVDFDIGYVCNQTV